MYMQFFGKPLNSGTSIKCTPQLAVKIELYRDT